MRELIHQQGQRDRLRTFLSLLRSFGFPSLSTHGLRRGLHSFAATRLRLLLSFTPPIPPKCSFHIGSEALRHPTPTTSSSSSVVPTNYFCEMNQGAYTSASHCSELFQQRSLT